MSDLKSNSKRITIILIIITQVYHMIANRGQNQKEKTLVKIRILNHPYNGQVINRTRILVNSLDIEIHQVS
jgi:hypothetical protein